MAKYCKGFAAAGLDAFLHKMVLSAAFTYSPFLLIFTPVFPCCSKTQAELFNSYFRIWIENKGELDGE